MAQQVPGTSKPSKKQRISNTVSTMGGIAGIIALIIVLLHLNMPAQTFSLLPGQIGATGQTGPPGLPGPAGADGTNAYNVTYRTILVVPNNQTLTVICTILKSQLNSSQNQTLTCKVSQ